VDLRVVKTLEVIEREFLTLRATSPLERIQVFDLCRRARINKSTFYRHFVNVRELSARLEEATVTDIMAGFAAVDRLFTDPEAFFRGLFAVVLRHSERVQILFRDRADALAGQVVARVKAHYLTAGASAEDEIMWSFLAAGAVHVFMDPACDVATATRTLAKLISKMAPPEGQGRSSFPRRRSHETAATGGPPTRVRPDSAPDRPTRTLTPS
jgi:AcrR family transcriptional regulator